MFLFVAPAVSLYCIFNYQVWGKLMAAFATGRGKYSLVRHDLAIRALELADIASFTARGGGASLQATIDHQDTRRIVSLGGVFSQNITYGLFVLLVVYSHLPNGIPAHGAHSNDGKLVTEEKWLYMFDAISMYIASLVYAVLFPGTLIQKAQDAADYSEISMVASRSESRDRLYP
ncbi:RTA1 like protein [Sanghuangporus baumii]|uniref:RTA1 like protein n=1 Tax=Sanghuangporus baumii TaxID=108892 RepID=A0A9Q5HS80_SANBA|nr:RTA1 like protein [Sanghuangporus baumii]